MPGKARERQVSKKNDGSECQVSIQAGARQMTEVSARNVSAASMVLERRQVELVPGEVSERKRNYVSEHQASKTGECKLGRKDH